MSEKLSPSQSDKYELFFTLGSFAMVPELFKEPATRQVAREFIRYGLLLDDGWDFGIDREGLNGHYIDSNDFYRYLEPQILQQLQVSEEQLYCAVERIEDINRRHLLHTNLQRFKDGIMMTEALALAVPFESSSWPPQYVETYRGTDTMIWGAMYTALKPHSCLVLPDVSLQVDIYTEPYVGLSRLYHHYALDLLNSGDEGNEALSLSWQMMYVQRSMDRDDVLVNQKYNTPAFFVFSEDEERSGLMDVAYQRREEEYLKRSNQFAQGFSLTRTVARVFPYIYSLASNYAQWRSTIPGWEDIYRETVSQSSESL